jgi:hypothetical protein
MDIKDGFTTSSNEQLRSLVRFHELDEITSNGGEDRSATKEHPRGIHSLRHVHHRSSHEYLRVVTVRGEGRAKPWSQPPID